MTHQNKILCVPMTLTTITPVTVGADKGENLSPYADYVFGDHNQSLHYINHKLVDKRVLAAGKLDLYIQGIRASIDNNRSDFNLKTFLKAEVGLSLEDMTRKVVPQSGMGTGGRLHIDPVVKNAGQPYIPGSTIKGAMRTAALYDWLVKTKVGEIELKKYAKVVKDLLPDAKKARELKRDRKFGEMKKIDREIQQKLKEVFVEENLFGSLTPGRGASFEEKRAFKGPEARHIRVSDTNPTEALAVHKLSRIRLNQAPQQEKSVIPQVLECIPKDTKLQFELAVMPSIKHESLQYWNSGNFNEIMDTLSAFSKDCIENELYDLRDARTHSVTKTHERAVERLIEFYEGLQERTERGEYLMRLGFGKTINDNSLILALLYGLDKGESGWSDFRDVVHRIRNDSFFFPVTRSVTAEGLPMGWVRVEKG